MFTTFIVLSATSFAFGFLVRSAGTDRINNWALPARVLYRAALVMLAGLTASAVLTATPFTTARLYGSIFTPFVIGWAAGKLFDWMVVRHLRTAGYNPAATTDRPAPSAPVGTVS